MRISNLVLSLCAATLLVTGCAKNQTEAKKAVDSIEESIKDIRADAERYAPDGLKSVESQIARFKADIEAKERNGYTPLTQAGWREYWDAAGLLMKAGATCQKADLVGEWLYTECTKRQ